MDKDRIVICNIISKMLDNLNEHGIYNATKVYDELEAYIHNQRLQAIGWTHADCCIDLDENRDPRKKDIPEMIERAKTDLFRQVN